MDCNPVGVVRLKLGRTAWGTGPRAEVSILSLMQPEFRLWCEAVP
jgi:hypothetical protein